MVSGKTRCSERGFWVEENLLAIRSHRSTERLRAPSEAPPQAAQMRSTCLMWCKCGESRRLAACGASPAGIQAERDVRVSNAFWSAQHPSREHDDGSQQGEYTANGDAEQPERQQEYPDDRVQQGAPTARAASTARERMHQTKNLTIVLHDCDESTRPVVPPDPQSDSRPTLVAVMCGTWWAWR